MAEVTIRPAVAADAAAYNTYRRRIADEPNNGITYSPGEYTRTVEEDRQRILDSAAADTWHILVAVVNDEIVGHCSCGGANRLALRHIVSLGIDVAREYRNRGVGSALMRAMIDWAGANPAIRRVELDVFTHNLPAIHLYLKYGFEIEGRRKRAYFKDGRFVDAYTMALLFDD
jgi:RimJ/RimL family protein N-acetyltransferase